MRISMMSAGLVAALVGYGGTIALVLSAATAVGATVGQTASWVLAVCLAKAAGSILLSSSTRVPVVLAWSTSGAALIAATTGVTLPQAVGAFLLAGALIALTAAIRPLGRAVGSIPDGLAAGMLAGVLLPFVMRLAGAAQTDPAMILPLVTVFALVRLWNSSIAVLAALATGVAVGLLHPASHPAMPLTLPHLTFITPQFDATVLIGLGLPLYLVTMASQNLPGFATLRAAGYEPPVRRALATTGLLSMLAGLFGGHTISMAAITAAICLGDDVHPDRDRRWKVGLAYGAIWIILGLLGPAILSLIAALPPGIVTALVALALLGPLTGALSAAFTPPPQRFAAVVTLTVTASGVAAFGIGAAFWGLVAGMAVFGLEHTTHRLRRP